MNEEGRERCVCRGCASQGGIAQSLENLAADCSLLPSPFPRVLLGALHLGATSVSSCPTRAGKGFLAHSRLAGARGSTYLCGCGGGRGREGGRKGYLLTPDPTETLRSLPPFPGDSRIRDKRRGGGPRVEEEPCGQLCGRGSPSVPTVLRLPSGARCSRAAGAVRPSFQG